MTKKVFFLTIFFSVLFSISKVSFGISQDNILSKAIELFDSKNYAEAEPLFKQLLTEKPEALELYYYYGACRTENQNYSEYDLIQLLNADANKSPQKINYYLGVQYQAQENWEQALKYYNKFRIAGSAVEKEGLDVAAKIQECYNQENPYKDLVKQVNEDSLPEPRIEITQTNDTLKTDSVIYSENDTIKYTTPQEPVLEEKKKTVEDLGEPIEFIVNSQITYYFTKHFQTEEGLNLFEESRKKQQRLDSVLSQTDKLREEYLAADAEIDKTNLGKKIVALETESYPLKEEITNLLLQAQNKESEFWSAASDAKINTFITKAEQQRKQAEQAKKPETPTVDSSDTATSFDPEILLSTENSEILLKEPENKDELIYRIQIGAYSHGLPAYVEKLYKKLSILRKIDNYTDDRGVVVYTTGKLTNLKDAIEMQKQVRQEGAEDAFVVPYFNGKRITLNEAKKIEATL